MAGEVRAKMIAGAAQLLAERGLQGTSFAEVIERTGAPRGSLYHHFPDGKDQLVDSAMELAGARALGFLDRKMGSSALEITEYFLFLWREVLSRSDFQAGCAVLAVTVATDSPELLARASGIFRAWRLRLAEMLRTGGLAKGDADRFAATLVAATEGAVVLSRAEQSWEPFDLVAEQLVDEVKRLAARSGAE
jgi:TetR/AcrR family transcriptional repressor of lmrAB and yxaGH operons